jgi:hypothetical protein
LSEKDIIKSLAISNQDPICNHNGDRNTEVINREIQPIRSDGINSCHTNEANIELGLCYETDDQGQDCSNCCTKDNTFSFLVKVPFPAQQAESGSVHDVDRFVTAFCAICIGTYQVGDCVTWSSNKACEHIFHKNCAIDWLHSSHKGKKRTRELHELAESSDSKFLPCPVCQQNFIAPDLDNSTVESLEDVEERAHETEDHNIMSTVDSDITKRVQISCV